MTQIPTAKEFLSENADRFQSASTDEWMIEFAKLHVDSALRAVEAKIIVKGYAGLIMNSYPLENID